MGDSGKTTNVIILKISLLSILVLISSIAVVFSFESAVAHIGWQAIAADSVSITEKNDNITELSLTTTSDLPPQNDMAHVGFGWLYADGAGAYVAAIHPSFRDSEQRPYGWHTHNVELELAEGGMITHCITAITDNDHAGLAITGDTITLNVRNSNFVSAFMDPPTAVAFDLIPYNDCPLNTGIAIHDIEPAIVAAAAEEEEEKKGGGQGGNPNK